MSELKVESKAKIHKFLPELNQKILQRICELGLTPQTEIVVKQKAFKNKTILICIRNYTLCLREEIAKCIVVEI